MVSQKKIETLLLEGTPFGLRYHDLANWTGRIFVSPRASFKSLLKREELSKPGMYLLIGEDNETSRLKVYIGEADVLKDRLFSHRSKDFWSEVIVCISKDSSLDKASVRYMESVLVEKAKQDKQCDLENGNTPAIKNLSEANIAAMDEFIENTVFIITFLGYKIVRYSAERSSVETEILYCSGPDSKATGRETDEGFVVYKNSHTRISETPTWEDSGKNLRKKLLENGVLVVNQSTPNSYLFTQDYVFSSPSSASGLVLARSSNGRLDWKNKKGKTLKELQEQ